MRSDGNRENHMNVFISHARNDTRLARAVTEELKKSGHVVKSAEGVEAGSDIESTIKSTLNECQAMIVILNPNSYQSQWVKYEVEHALTDENYKGRLLPVLVGKDFESAPKKTPWILTSLQHVTLPDTDDVIGSARKVAKEFSSIVGSGGPS